MSHSPGSFVSLNASTRSNTLVSPFQAEKRLQEMEKHYWDEFVEKGKEYTKNPDEASAVSIVEEMLEKAIEFARTKEQVEEEHLAAAHEQLKMALKKEAALEAMAAEVQHDADDADIILDTYEKSRLMEDREKRRELAISDISHHVEDYVETRLREAKEAEALAAEEEKAASRILRQLKKNEEELKATLEELKEMKKEES